MEEVPKEWYCVRCDEILIFTKADWKRHEEWHEKIKRANMKVRFK